MDLIKINPAEYGLEETKANEISAMFKPMLDRMVELEKVFNKINAQEINENTCLQAKRLRLEYVRVRTGTADIHKQLKSFYLRGGRFVDGWKNAQLAASGEMEEKLNAIENHFENLQKEKIAKLQEERSEKITKYIDVIPETLGLMTNEVWANFSSGTKTNYKIQKEAEKKAERQRIEKEKKAREEKKRINAENAKLRLEAIEREEIANLEAKKRKEEAEQRVKDEAERLRKENEAKTIREEKERKERKENEAKLQAERDERERIEREAAAEKKRLEDKLREQAEAEGKRLQAIEDKRQAELNMGDADKVEKLITDLSQLTTKYEFQSVKNKRMYSNVGDLLNKIITYIPK